MKNDNMLFFLYSIKLAESKELGKTFLTSYSKTFFFYINNRYKKNIKRKNDNNQV